MKKYDVTKYGAVPDGKTVCTESSQQKQTEKSFKKTE